MTVLQSNSSRNASTLLLVEHKNSKLSSSTLNALTAAHKLNHPVSALVAGASPDAVAQATAALPGVEKVIVAKHDAYEHGLPEAYAPLLVAAVKAGDFSHVVAAHSAFGKNIMPRAAAILDVGQISDVIAVQGEDSFVRPIYAGRPCHNYDRFWIANSSCNDGCTCLQVMLLHTSSQRTLSSLSLSEPAPSPPLPLLVDLERLKVLQPPTHLV